VSRADGFSAGERVPSRPGPPASLSADEELPAPAQRSLQRGVCSAELQHRQHLMPSPAAASS